jgi:DNA-damage-inducible protein J
MTAPASTMLHIRVDQELKDKATETLDQMGLSMSEAVRLLLTRIAVERTLPFEVRVPNAATVAAMEAGNRGEVSKALSVAEMMARLHESD